MSLELHDVSLQIQGKRLLNHIDVCIESGKVIGVIGANGAGKTSLLRVASGELSAADGGVHLNGTSLNRLTRESLACQIAVLPQHSMLDFPFRVDEVLHMGRIPHMTGQLIDRAIVDEVTEIMELEAFKHRIYTTLSGGERQRVQIGRVLCQLWDVIEQGYLLFDEPTAPLDLSHQLAFLLLVKQLARRGAGIMLILHDINLAARFADHIVLLDDGHVLAKGRPRDVLTRENIGAGFGVEVELVPMAEGNTRLIIATAPRAATAGHADINGKSGRNG